ncbi:MAG: TRAP transporter large permease subunit, partial [Bacteroidetes bacterium]
GVVLVVLYVVYIMVISQLKPSVAPSMLKEEIAQFRQKGMMLKIFKAFLLPFLLIFAVLGSIFAGIASPTEAAAVGAGGATLLTVFQGKFNMSILKEVMKETTHLTCMVFIILVGATAFSLVFRGLEGDTYFINLIENAQLTPQSFLLLVMAAVFVAGFFIDFIEIIFIIVPVVAPIFLVLEIDLIWVGILIALNLQTSFLTPPFGFSLFYLKGVAPPQVTTMQLYRGIIPFVIIQMIFLVLIILFPEIISWFPNWLGT